jgi:hypothetical protein
MYMIVLQTCYEPAADTAPVDCSRPYVQAEIAAAAAAITYGASLVTRAYLTQIKAALGRAHTVQRVRILTKGARHVDQ